MLLHYFYTVLNGAGTREFGLDLRLGAAGKIVWTEVLRGRTVLARNTRIGIRETASARLSLIPKIKAKYSQCVVGYLSIVKQRDVFYS